MRPRQELTDLISRLNERAIPDVRNVFGQLRDDLANTLADLAADVLLHQERCESFLDGLPEDAFDDPRTAALVRQLEPPFWSLIVEDFRRLAAWVPRQRLARFGEDDALRAFRDRLIAALRPALVELQRYGVLRNGGRILDDDFWDAADLYDLAVRYEGFSLELYRAIEGRIRADSHAQERIEETLQAA